ncbi:endonuclease [Limosilactobacillus reuteri]|uniref:NUMOD4 domain-containing protein n=1 Tax=Lactobacillaceae TaxID=33958 RepID=UPI000A1E9A8F|nr:NUMOD4 domain-containing protein [Limosilactobacillus reuteri]MCC4492048.1 NUMOD4 motif-containing HNH endonuclease [Limosilactobacillus reuteri]MDZ5438665.1 NUMOD4 domain-containing protein [Limosilactobacillus reuteri]QLL75763.1 endonuclease [Limosilactobacillus reuteri]ROV62800.1 endonuclease [Limosilactobacillus reuteri]
MEEWKDIKDYEGYYQISNFGHVRSVDRIVKSKGNSTQQRKGQILRPNKNRYGYLKVVLQKQGKSKTKSIHRLVATAFIPNPNNFSQINHIDECKTNNHADNLEWCTAKYNSNYGTRIGRVAKSKSRPVIQIAPNGQIIEYWPSAKEAVKRGFNDSDIAAVCRGKCQMHKGYRWIYADNYHPQENIEQ